MSAMSRQRPRWQAASGQKAGLRLILTLCHTSALAGNMVSVPTRHEQLRLLGMPGLCCGEFQGF